jgi:hypothetical protein
MSYEMANGKIEKTFQTFQNRASRITQRDFKTTKGSTYLYSLVESLVRASIFWRTFGELKTNIWRT